MVDLVALARARGLERLARRLIEKGLTRARPSLDAPTVGPLDVPTALGMMRRRGLAPALVRRVLLWFEHRPLELGLFSWDALSSSLLDVDDTSLLAELRRNAVRVRPLLPAPASTFVNSRSMTATQAIEAFARARNRDLDDDALMHAATQDRALGALDELRRRYGRDTLADGGVVASTIQFARLLHLSHLSTLASLYADYAFHVLGARDALPELVEILLDVGAGDSLPPPSEFSPDGTAEQLDLLGYAAARAAIVAGNAAAVAAELQAAMNTDYQTSIADVLRMPRSHVVLADAAAEQDQIVVPFEVVDQIAITNSEWRYAHRVRAVLSGLVQRTVGAELPLLWVDGFVDAFGNDFALWYETGIVGINKSWRTKLVERAASEVAALPHDFMAWAGLAALIDPDGELVGEVNTCAGKQCELVQPV